MMKIHGNPLLQPAWPRKELIICCLFWGTIQQAHIWRHCRRKAGDGDDLDRAGDALMPPVRMWVRFVCQLTDFIFCIYYLLTPSIRKDFKNFIASEAQFWAKYTVSVISWKKRTAKLTRSRIPRFYLSVPYPPSLICNITGNLVSQFHQQLTTPTALFWRNIHAKNNLVLVARPVAFTQPLRHKINKQTNR